jgi:integrase
LKRGLDFDTALNALLTLSAVLTEAVEDGLITHNPALRSGKLLKRPATIEESELAIFTPEEEGLLLETIRRERPLFYPMALTFFRTGLRAGEVLGLHRGDLNFHSRSIYVQRNWSRESWAHPRTGRPAGGHVAGSRKGSDGMDRATGPGGGRRWAGST